jgi:hypothetical protein
VLQERFVMLGEALEDDGVREQFLPHAYEGADDIDAMVTARGLRRIVAAMIAPCSVKTRDGFRRPPRPSKITDCDLRRVVPRFDITICDIKRACSSWLISKIKSEGNRDRFRRMAWLKTVVDTP